MKTLKENTNDFLRKVKDILDNAIWDYTCNQRESKDVEKAISFLGTQKFSIKKVREYSEIEWDEYVLKNDMLDNCYSHEDCVNYVAQRIANKLAFDRISKFKHKGLYNESLVFFLI